MSVHPSIDPHALLEMEKEMGWPILREEEWKEAALNWLLQNSPSLLAACLTAQLVSEIPAALQSPPPLTRSLIQPSLD